MAELKQIDIKELLNHMENKILIDVRSPKEFEEFHMPNAINIPLFTNHEREIVGTLFKQVGPDAAKAKGIEFVSPKLPLLYNQIHGLCEQGEVVIYCWRGGMRSKSLATFMTAMGSHTFQLKGGIRSFRRLITEELAEFSTQQKPFFVIEGYTGSRKTDMLQSLSHEGYPVIDLEGLSDHRGSIFGSIGLSPRSQKAFDYYLWMRLHELKDANYYIIEGESKRIGRIVIPRFIYNGKVSGTRLQIQYPFEKRIEAIIDEYDPIHHKEDITASYESLKKYLTPPLVKELDTLIQNENWKDFVAILLTEHYDPKYRHQHKNYMKEANLLMVSTVEEGVEAIKSELKRAIVVS